MTPLLILLFGIHPATAVGTDLLYAAVTKTCGTFVHGYAHTVDWRVVRRLARRPSVLATLMGVVGDFVPPGEMLRPRALAGLFW